MPLLLLIPLLVAIVGLGCDGPPETSDQPLGPTTVPATRFPPQGFTIEGRKSLTALGDTSQLRAVVRWADGTSEDVTAGARWHSHNPSVVAVSNTGLATALGFGAARIDAGYDTLGNSSNPSSALPRAKPRSSQNSRTWTWNMTSVGTAALRAV